MTPSDCIKRAFEDAAIGIAILSVNPLGRYIEVNPSFCRMTGYSRDELLNRDFQSITVSQDIDKNLEHCRAMLRGSYPAIQFEKRYIRKDGSSFWSCLNASLVRDPGGKPLFFIVQIEDNNARKEAEDRSSRQGAVLHKLHEINLLPTLEEPIFYDKVTEAMASFFGVSVASIQELDASEIEVLSMWKGGKTGRGMRFPISGTPCENVQKFKTPCQYRGILKDLFPEDGFLKDQGLQSYLGIPILNGQGQVVAIATLIDELPRRFSVRELEMLELFGQTVGTFLERKRLEEQLRHSHKLEAIGQLAGGIAHEFNNILTAVIGNLELARTRDISPADRESVMDSAQKAANRAVMVTKQLLNFGRKSELKREAHDIGAIAGDTVRLLRQTIDRRIGVEFSSEKELWPVLADPDQIHQIAMNLCVNARDAILERLTHYEYGSQSPPGSLDRNPGWQPRISVHTGNTHVTRIYKRSRPDSRPGDFVSLTVTDNGSGIPETIRSHLFEPFFTTKSAGRGTGLGLATVYSIVKQHDGWIEVENKPGPETSFRILLPRTAKKKKTENVIRNEAGWKGHETILFVDDEKSIRLLGRTILERNGYTVIQAKDGEEAMNLFQKERRRIGLVILDLGMPLKSGDEVLRKIRAVEPGMRVIVSSGNATRGDTPLTRSLKADGVIPKPYHPNELLRSVRTLLDTRHSA